MKTMVRQNLVLPLLLVGLLVGLASAGCDGQLDLEAGQRATHGTNPQTPGAGSEGGPLDSPEGSEAATDPSLAGPVGGETWVRLNRGEMRRSLESIFGELGFAAVEDYLPPDGTVGALYDGNTDPTPGPIVDKMLDLAESDAAVIAANLDAVAPCEGEDVDCAKQFVDSYATRIFRRPLTDDARQMHHDFVADVADSSGYVEAVRLWVTAALQSPYFLYRVELSEDAENGEAKLDGWEVASRLSFFLWREAPDDVLFAAAADGELDTAEGVERQARRMMDDERYHRSVAHFLRQWADVALPEEPRKDVTEEEFAAIGRELGNWFDAMAASGELDYPNLIAADWTVANESLADHYGAEHPAEDPDEWVRVELEERAGFLTRSAVLMSDTDDLEPIFRGHRILTNVLCLPIGDAVPLDAIEEDALTVLSDASLPMRERLAPTETSQCAGCHALLNPLGYAYLHYDTAGEYRTEEFPGVPIDASGTFTAGSTELVFEDAVELAHLLARSPDAHECFTRQAFRYGLRRDEVRGDEASIDSARARFTEQNFTIDELVLGIVTSRAFRHVAAPEATETN